MQFGHIEYPHGPVACAEYFLHLPSISELHWVNVPMIRNLVCLLVVTSGVQADSCLEYPDGNLYRYIFCASINYLRVFIFFFSVALGECAKDKESLKNIHALDGVRLVWSLLKHPSERVRILEY